MLKKTTEKNKKGGRQPSKVRMGMTRPWDIGSSYANTNSFAAISGSVGELTRRLLATVPRLLALAMGDPLLGLL